MSTQQMNLAHFDLAVTSGLSPAECDVYARVEEDGESIAEAAAARGTSESTVRTLLHRARRKKGESPRIGTRTTEKPTHD